MSPPGNVTVTSEGWLGSHITAGCTAGTGIETWKTEGTDPSRNSVNEPEEIWREGLTSALAYSDIVLLTVAAGVLLA